MIMAVPFVTYGSNDAKTPKTEVLLSSETGIILADVSEFEAYNFEYSFGYVSYNYVAGPNFAGSFELAYLNVAQSDGLHNRWYIDTNTRASDIDNLPAIRSGFIPDLRTNEPDFVKYPLRC